MLKQNYGKYHNRYTGYRRRGNSGRCKRCTSLLTRVARLPPELNQAIFRLYQTGLRRRVVLSRNRQVNIRKRLWRAK